METNFIVAERNIALLHAYSRASSIFGMGKRFRFLPHISLLYGRFNVATKRKIIARLHGSCDVSFRVNSIHVVLSSSNTDPKHWRKLRKFPLLG
jgi:2'-5' RNA ligase